MSQAALFYQQAVPINPQRHAASCVDTTMGYAYARNTQAVMIAFSEFTPAGRDYPIVFIQDGDTDIPAALLGLRTNQNLFVNAAGEWHGTYIPAYVRRYPFILSGKPDDSQLLVCIDEACPGLSPDKGERLFREDGGQTQYLKERIGFLQRCQSEFDETRRLMKMIRNAGLLESMSATVELKSGKKLQVNGFLTVNRARLKEIKGGTLVELHRSGALELIYLHLASLGTFSKLADRITDVTQSAASA